MNRRKLCKNKPRRSKLFIHRTLLCLQFLQGQTKYQQGAHLKAITAYFRRHYTVDGDVLNQVVSSLKECVHYGFVQKYKCNYVLIGPVANVILTDHNSEDRENQFNRTKKIFKLTWSNKKTDLRNSEECGEKPTHLHRFIRRIGTIFRPKPKIGCKCSDAEINAEADDDNRKCVGNRTGINMQKLVRYKGRPREYPDATGNHVKENTRKVVTFKDLKDLASYPNLTDAKLNKYKEYKYTKTEKVRKFASAKSPSPEDLRKISIEPQDKKKTRERRSPSSSSSNDSRESTPKYSK